MANATTNATEQRSNRNRTRQMPLHPSKAGYPWINTSLPFLSNVIFTCCIFLSFSISPAKIRIPIKNIPNVTGNPLAIPEKCVSLQPVYRECRLRGGRVF